MKSLRLLKYIVSSVLLLGFFMSAMSVQAQELGGYKISSSISSPIISNDIQNISSSSVDPVLKTLPLKKSGYVLKFIPKMNGGLRINGNFYNVAVNKRASIKLSDNLMNRETLDFVSGMTMLPVIFSKVFYRPITGGGGVAAAPKGPCDDWIERMIEFLFEDRGGVAFRGYDYTSQEENILKGIGLNPKKTSSMRLIFEAIKKATSIRYTKTEDGKVVPTFGGILDEKMVKFANLFNLLFTYGPQIPDTALFSDVKGKSPVKDPASDRDSDLKKAFREFTDEWKKTNPDVPPSATLMGIADFITESFKKDLDVGAFVRDVGGVVTEFTDERGRLIATNLKNKGGPKFPNLNAALDSLIKDLSVGVGGVVGTSSGSSPASEICSLKYARELFENSKNIDPALKKRMLDSGLFNGSSSS